MSTTATVPFTSGERVAATYEADDGRIVTHVLPVARVVEMGSATRSVWRGKQWRVEFRDVPGRNGGGVHLFWPEDFKAGA